VSGVCVGRSRTRITHVKAIFLKGVLTITLQKLPQAKGRQIAVSKG
jgi:HSP20 family molecular chaperone IbpA